MPYGARGKILQRQVSWPAYSELCLLSRLRENSLEPYTEYLDRSLALIIENNMDINRDWCVA